jgi:hypothetical protein
MNRSQTDRVHGDDGSLILRCHASPRHRHFFCCLTRLAGLSVSTSDETTTFRQGLGHFRSLVSYRHGLARSPGCSVRSVVDDHQDIIVQPRYLRLLGRAYGWSAQLRHHQWK